MCIIVCIIICILAYYAYVHHNMDMIMCILSSESKSYRQLWPFPRPHEAFAQEQSVCSIGMLSSTAGQPPLASAESSLCDPAACSILILEQVVECNAATCSILILHQAADAICA